MSQSLSAPWLNFYGDMPKTIQYPEKTVFEMVQDAARKYPSHIAYEFQGKQTTYKEFISRVELTAKSLLAMGIRKGDRVTVCMPNTPQGVDMFYACNRIGAVANMIHPLSASGEIEFYLNFSHSKVILTVDMFYYKVAETLPQLKEPCRIIVARIQDELPAATEGGLRADKARKIKKASQKEGELHPLVGLSFRRPAI